MKDPTESPAEEVLTQGLAQSTEQHGDSDRALRVERQLHARFGELPPWVREHLQIASNERLDALVERIPHAHSLDEILGPP